MANPQAGIDAFYQQYLQWANSGVARNSGLSNPPGVTTAAPMFSGNTGTPLANQVNTSVSGGNPNDTANYQIYIANGGRKTLAGWQASGRPFSDSDYDPYGNYIGGQTFPTNTPAPGTEPPAVATTPAGAGSSPGALTVQGGTNTNTLLDDDVAYKTYYQNGGTKSQVEWRAAGRPTSDATGATGTGTGEGDKGTGGTGEGKSPTYHDSQGNTWYYDEFGEKKDTGYDAQYDSSKQGGNPPQVNSQNTMQDGFGHTAYWNGRSWDYPPNWGQNPAYDQAANDRQQKQFELSQQQFQWEQEQAKLQAEQQKQQYLANLRANPKSWLEYAAAAGETPAIQPWMLPLNPGQQGWSVGAALPGWSGDNKKSMSDLSALTTPSAQYMNSIAPSARQQYQGYEQARTGATPEDTQWRMWAYAPPSGQFGGARYTR
jgi:hypothetical protein